MLFFDNTRTFSTRFTYFDSDFNRSIHHFVLNYTFFLGLQIVVVVQDTLLQRRVARLETIAVEEHLEE